MPIKVIAFDLDGTLYPTSEMYFKSLPVLLCHPKLVYYFNKTRKRIRKIRPISDFFNFQTQLFSRLSGIPVEKADNLIKTVVYDDWFKRFSGVKPFKGLPPILHALKKMDYKLAVVSDYPVEEKLRHLGLADIWDAAFSSESTGYLKPNPEPFAEILKIFSINPTELLYVGDNYYYDIVGAKKLGIKTAYLCWTARKRKFVDMPFRHYGEFISKMNKIFS
ncbi:MAG: HAD family hydrolase [Spirochaetales bacterium]|nr:HAD family hydrolase [Spirochaetales bacterium]